MANIWAIADLHLAIAEPQKDMKVFGGRWVGYMEKIQQHWKEVVQPEDLVLIPGDISWAMKLAEAKIDLDWLSQLPGTKVLLRGNHDYWWDSLKKISTILPPDMHLVQNNCFMWNNIAIGGSRLWDTYEYNFGPGERDENSEEAEKIFVRELARLEMSLKSIPPTAKLRIIMTHYPPIGADLKESRVSQLLEKYDVNICVFGHLHNVADNQLPFGEKAGIRYHLVAGDHLNFKPLKIV